MFLSSRIDEVSMRCQTVFAHHFRISFINPLSFLSLDLKLALALVFLFFWDHFIILSSSSALGLESIFSSSFSENVLSSFVLAHCPVSFVSSFALSISLVPKWVVLSLFLLRLYFYAASNGATWHSGSIVPATNTVAINAITSHFHIKAFSFYAVCTSVPLSAKVVQIHSSVSLIGSGDYYCAKLRPFSSIVSCSLCLLSKL